MTSIVPLARSAAKGLKLFHGPLNTDDWRQRLADEPTIPADYAACLALARRIFHGRQAYAAEPRGSLHPSLHAIASDPQRTSMTLLLQVLGEGLRNPHLTPEQIAELDATIATTIPPLPKNYATQHFYINYTDDDPDPRNNSQLFKMQSLGNILESAWAKFDYTSNRAPTVTPGSFSNQIEISLYYLSNTYGFTNPSSGITLDSETLGANARMRAETPPHELFHRLSYAFGYSRRFPYQASDNWWAEGMAQWAGLWVTGNTVTANSRFTSMFAVPTTSVSSRSYDSAPLWVFLEGQTIRGNPNFFGPLNFLNSYTVDGNTKRAFATVIMDAFRGIAQDNLDWYINRFYLNSMTNGWKSTGTDATHAGSVLYPIITDYSATTCVPPFPTIAATGHVSQTSTPRFDGSLPQGAAAFYKFTYDANLNGRPITISVDGKNNAKFFLANRAMKNDGMIVSTHESDMTASGTAWNRLTAGPTFDYVLAIVSYEHSSGGVGASGDFQIRSWNNT